jgi:hypothetical protein
MLVPVMGEFTDYAVLMASGDMMYKPSFMASSSGIQIALRSLP